MKLDSDLIKSAILQWLRYIKKLDYIATEAAPNAADCIGTDGKKLIEVEVKISWRDFLNDFSKRKHKIISELVDQTHNPNLNISQPNYFYFAVPKALADHALKRLKDSPYGLIIVEPFFDNLWRLDFVVKVIKKPKKIHNERPDPWIVSSILKRMGSDLVGNYKFMAAARGLRYQIKTSTKPE